ncbi:unnamed protein product [Gongylonema pulchrum]|uniref:Uncharacterized protein n=1 Tax=Gongylonema pulchrum TaxID=637853 RepID=A0A3P6S1Y3_9BILA|nr:unnamed protein product [Gongylonema pulchrum]
MRPVIEDDGEEKHIKARPPLNRSIPPIPESKSNDSIMTNVSERHSASQSEQSCSAPRFIRQPLRIRHTGQAGAPPRTKASEDTLASSSKVAESDGSLVIENKMAQNLATKRAVIVSTRSRRSDEVPRSPLMSVAHTVRTGLTKLGSRFSRSDPNQNIRTSTSLLR